MCMGGWVGRLSILVHQSTRRYHNALLVFVIAQNMLHTLSVCRTLYRQPLSWLVVLRVLNEVSITVHNVVMTTSF